MQTWGIDLKVSVRQNDNTNYSDGSINEVTFSPLNDPTWFRSGPPIGKRQGHLTDPSGTMNESDTHILKN